MFIKHDKKENQAVAVRDIGLRLTVSSCDELDDTDALRLEWIVLATEGVLVHCHANLHQRLVYALHVVGVGVHATVGVGHGFLGRPSLVCPVTRVDQLAVTNVGQHKLCVAFEASHDAVHGPRAVNGGVWLRTVEVHLN